MDTSFSGKTVLITGAGSGIGKATAIAFGKMGANVVVADIQESSDTLQQIEAFGSRAVFVKCDVSKESEVAAMVEQVVNEFGSLDAAFNNAGIEGSSGLIQELSEVDFDRVISVNLKGIFFCMKYEIKQMLKQGRGAIVNCSSIAGLVGFPGLSAYVSSKHAVVGLTKTVALENAKNNIRVNAVCPGVINTPMIERFTHSDPVAEAQLTAGEPVGRLGNPEEIASAVVWLCSDGASFTTGQALAVDGGWVAQ